MRNPAVILLIIVAAIAIGVGVGWGLRSEAPGSVRIVALPPLKTPRTTETPPATPPKLPEYPKPSLETPVPVVDDAPIPTSSAPAPLGGDLPTLPGTTPGGAMVGPIIPAAPEAGAPLHTADLNADEALTRRTILQAGGEVVSVDDAKDASGKVGRSLTAETANGNREKLHAALRKALGDRAILSDGGFVNESTPELRKAEDGLAALRKQRDQARIDFLPEAPILRDLEESYQKQERALGELKKKTVRLRLNVFLRPVLGT